MLPLALLLSGAAPRGSRAPFAGACRAGRLHAPMPPVGQARFRGRFFGVSVTADVQFEDADELAVCCVTMRGLPLRMRGAGGKVVGWARQRRGEGGAVLAPKFRADLNRLGVDLDPDTLCVHDDALLLRARVPVLGWRGLRLVRVDDRGHRLAAWWTECGASPRDSLLEL